MSPRSAPFRRISPPRRSPSIWARARSRSSDARRRSNRTRTMSQLPGTSPSHRAVVERRMPTTTRRSIRGLRRRLANSRPSSSPRTEGRLRPRSPAGRRPSSCSRVAGMRFSTWTTAGVPATAAIIARRSRAPGGSWTSMTAWPGPSGWWPRVLPTRSASPSVVGPRAGSRPSPRSPSVERSAPEPPCSGSATFAHS